MQFNSVNNKEHQHSLVVSGFCIYACIRILCALCLRHSCACFKHELAALWGGPGHCPGSFPLPFPPSFHCSVWWVPVFLSYVGAHGWVAWICQPWEKSPSRSWLPVVEGPGCFKAPNLHLAVVNVYYQWIIFEADEFTDYYSSTPYLDTYCFQVSWWRTRSVSIFFKFVAYVPS